MDRTPPIILVRAELRSLLLLIVLVIIIIIIMIITYLLLSLLQRKDGVRDALNNAVCVCVYVLVLVLYLMFCVQSLSAVCHFDS